MSTELAEYDPNKAIVKLESLDLAAFDKQVEAEESRGGFYPGTVYVIKKGKLRKGFGKDAPIIKERDMPSMILNLANMWFGWQRFADGKPVFGPIGRPLAGEKLRPREKLDPALMNKDEWDTFKDQDTGVERPVDPWQRYAAIPFRFDGEETINTIVCSSWSQINEVRELLKNFSAEYRKNIGKMPVCNMESEERKHWDADNNATWDVAVLNIVDWEDPIDADFPKDGFADPPPQIETEVKTDVEVETRTRTKDDTARGDTRSSDATDGNEDAGEIFAKLDAESEAERNGSAESDSSESSSKSSDDPEMWGGSSGRRKRKAAA